MLSIFFLTRCVQAFIRLVSEFVVLRSRLEFVLSVCLFLKIIRFNTVKIILSLTSNKACHGIMYDILYEKTLIIYLKISFSKIYSIVIMMFSPHKFLPLRGLPLTQRSRNAHKRPCSASESKNSQPSLTQPRVCKCV